MHLITCIADSVAVSVAFSCLSSDTATATRIAPAALSTSTDYLIAVPREIRRDFDKLNLRNEKRWRERERESERE